VGYRGFNCRSIANAGKHNPCLHALACGMVSLYNVAICAPNVYLKQLQVKLAQLKRYFIIEM